MLALSVISNKPMIETSGSTSTIDSGWEASPSPALDGDETLLSPVLIKVVGVGGGGGNAIDGMISTATRKLAGVEFIAMNTDTQALSKSSAEVRTIFRHLPVFSKDTTVDDFNWGRGFVRSFFIAFCCAFLSRSIQKQRVCGFRVREALFIDDPNLPLSPLASLALCPRNPSQLYYNLYKTRCQVKVPLGSGVTRGLGAGGKPYVGQAAAEESLTEIQNALAGADMVFVTAGEELWCSVVGFLLLFCDPNFSRDVLLLNQAVLLLYRTFWAGLMRGQCVFFIID